MLQSQKSYNYLNISEDYYPFGMIMPNRHGSSADGYRYGFQGQEGDDEIKGEGNNYGYEARMYDSRIGRWLSRDAVEFKKPFLSPYQSFRNNPIYYVDPDGKDEWKFYSDGSWSYEKTEKHDGEVGYGYGDHFITVDENGNGNNLFCQGNNMLGALPFVDTPQQDLNDEFSTRPSAWELFKVLNPGEANVQNLVMAYTIIDAVVGVVEGVAGVISITKVVYKGGKMVYSLMRAGKAYDNVETAGKGIKIGKITYQTSQAFIDVTDRELDFLSYLNKLGEETLVLIRKTGSKTSDFKIKGLNWELKSIEDITSKDMVRAVKDRILSGKEQAKNIVGDVRYLDNFNVEDASKAAKSAFSQSSKPQKIRFVGKGYDKTFKRSDFFTK